LASVVKARYKPCLDPTLEDVKKLCISLRRSAKEERVLFHYNGHGVPKPTNNGEIWVFNKVLHSFSDSTHKKDSSSSWIHI
jgi:regulator-associated protein of mTOR